MLPAVATVLSVGAVIAVVLWQLHLNLVLSNTSTTGGDTGAHFMMPAYLQGLVRHGHLTGWDPAWYDGYPIYTFYFVLPDLLAAVAGWIIPYGIAFKLVTVLGSVTMPVAAWACGRLFRLRPPAPALLAAATLPFLFEYSFTIYGGNLFSTLAGEYAYSLSIGLALVFLGLVAAGLRTGKYRGWAAVVLAACLLCHIVPAMYAIGGAVVLTAMELLPRRLRPVDDVAGRWMTDPGGPVEPGGTPDRASEGSADAVAGSAVRSAALRWVRRARIASLSSPTRAPLAAVWWAGSTVVLGIALSAWWLIPFGLRQSYATAMGYENVTTYVHILFPESDLWVLSIAAVGLVLAVAKRSRFGLLIAALGGLSVLGLVIDPQGSLYNVRLLPLWFLSVYLLAGWGFAVVAHWAALSWRRLKARVWIHRLAAAYARRGPLPPRPRVPRWPPAAVGGALAGILASLLVVLPPLLPSWLVPAGSLPVSVGANQVSSWSSWNYTGYEGKPAYPELLALRRTMARIGRQRGCGRAMWEYSPDLDRFGTPMALMLLPYWTGGCIDSMEGLLFESSTTTPYHFLNQAELSAQPSEPMVGLPYSGVDVPLGVEHLQMLGVRYFMASSPQVRQAALEDPALRLIATTGPWTSPYGSEKVTTTWDVFEVENSSPVTPLSYEPAVERGIGQTQKSWLNPSVAWYDDPSRWNVELAADGPPNWPRVAIGDRHPPAVRVPPTTVSDVRQSGGTISFSVTRPGTPVLVKTSYFPNWQAQGARGPWRVTPNLMVVVPTSRHVTLVYGSTTANGIGTVATVVAAAVVVTMAAGWAVRRRGARRRREAGGSPRRGPPWAPGGEAPPG